LAQQAPAFDGYFRWVGTLSSESHSAVVKGVSGTGSCSIAVTKKSASTQCASRAEWHSSNTNHTHFPVGEDTSDDWESFPASGNHWGAWPTWDQVYEQPVKKGFLLHGLEHGGIAMSYVGEGQTNVVDLFKDFGQHRSFVTPDPDQPAEYGLRAWRWAYLSDCYDHASAVTFMNSHIAQGREDIDADPPFPFDPSTTDVPCEDLMAAPDSC
jgi:hypothetical protein